MLAGGVSVCGRLLLHDGVHPAVGAGFVYQINRLVGQVSLVDIFSAHLHGVFQYAVLIGYAVESFIRFPQTFQNQNSILHAGFFDVYILESAYQAFIFCKMLFVFLVGGGADETDVPGCQIGLQHVGDIEGSAVYRARAHDIVDFIDIDNGLFLLA